MNREIEPGRILLLWREGGYDGMLTGIGLLDGNPVYLDATNQMGGRVVKPPWQSLENLLDELLDPDDAENIWDRIERKYDEKMHETQKRVFEVRELTPEIFDAAKARHRQWQLHVGLHSDFLYEDGKPVYPNIPTTHEDFYWDNSREYVAAHYHDVWRGDDPLRDSQIKTLPILGVVSWADLFAKSAHRPPFHKDPRSDALKAYQATWRPGHPVKLDWS